MRNCRDGWRYGCVSWATTPCTRSICLLGTAPRMTRSVPSQIRRGSGGYEGRGFPYHANVEGSPRRLLVIATGNIRNDELVALVEKNFSRIEGLFETPAHVEMSRVALTVRE